MLFELLGGALIGLGASLAWIGARRVAGVSGLAGSLFTQGFGGIFPLGFLGGLVLAGLVLAPASSIAVSPTALPLLALGGLLVGFGTQLGSGCTSGHGVCGVSRLSSRSLVATAVFVATGMATATLLAHAGPP